MKDTFTILKYIKMTRVFMATYANVFVNLAEMEEFLNEFSLQIAILSLYINNY